LRNLRILITTALMIALSSLGVSAASAADRVATDCTSASRAQAPQAAAAPVTVWLAGDSTMANPSSGRCPVGWGSQFDALFNSEVTVKNQAVGGRSIQTWLYEGNVSGTKGSDGECRLTSTTYSSRWQAMLNSTTGMKAGDYLLIQFGINDLLLTPVAAITCSGGTATKNRGFVTQTLAAGAATRAPVIDLQTLSVSLYNSLHFCPNNGDYGGSGPLGTFFCNDHTHFDTYGAQRVAGLVAGDVRRQNLPLAVYLT
jgi:lysophospholipase L1-like esterase